MSTRRGAPSGDRLLTVAEVASLMRVSNMTVYRLIKAGHLGAIRVGKNYRIRESDVNRYFNDRAVHFEDVPAAPVAGRTPDALKDPGK